MSYPGFIKLMRTRETEELLKLPSAFLLLAQIAMRARRNGDFNADGLKSGEAKVGDFKAIGLTQGKYRRAKKKLEEARFATFQPTNGGTVARLSDSRIWDINLSNDSEPASDRTTNQRRMGDELATTNKKIRSTKNVRSSTPSAPFSSVIDIYQELLVPPLAHLAALTEERRDVLRERWLQVRGETKDQKLDWFKRYFRRVQQSDFLRNGTEKWKPDFDWLMKQENLVKVLEGRYDNNK